MCRNAVLALLSVALAATTAHAVHSFAFRDVGEQCGLFPHGAGIRGHGAAWGDVDGDGYPDLYIGTFATADGKPNLFLRNRGGKFTLDTQDGLRLSSRSTGMLFADFDNDGDLDLYIASMPVERGRPLRGCAMFRNDDRGKFTDISEGNGACPTAFGGRGTTVLDFDGDGLLDLLAGEDSRPRYNGSPTKSSRLFRNLGNLKFEDVSRSAGLPEGVPGLGVAAGDVNNDGFPDCFIASADGGNVLFINNGNSTFREAPGSRKVFAWPGSGGDNMIAGVNIADVNRDGLLDIVIGQHYDHPWRDPVPIRLYLNRGTDNVGNPSFEDATKKVGLHPLGMKAPHIEVQDFDNDGWPDIYVSIVKFADSKPYPVIYRGLGMIHRLPQFREDAWGVNDFPNASDLATGRSTQLFDKVNREKTIFYSAPGPSADFDNDGRLDLFLPSWWPETRSLLLKNETPGGNWLRVKVRGRDGVNHMGIGSRVCIYPTGKLGDAASILGCREIATGYGYASGQPAEVHFGLGMCDAVDIEVTLPHRKGTIIHKGVRSNQIITVER